ncbi:MAG: hypothetical protein IKO01_11600 [Kiritimatiellae bacterium]|nr:hypothetical protein [Kiritimatiellia bacterium]
MIGKKFSNGWKNPPIFSNDWKNFSPVFQRLEKIFRPFSGNKTDNKTPGGQNRRTNPTIPDNFWGGNLDNSCKVRNPNRAETDTAASPLK